MGQLWLRSEVDSLEYKMKYSLKTKKLPTCIVIDSDALINYSLIIKKLVNSSKFIVVVPAIGVCFSVRGNSSKYFLIVIFFGCFSDISIGRTEEIEQRS